MGTAAMADRFTLEVRWRDGMAVLELVGDIDHEAEAELAAAWEQVRAAGARSVLLNFERVGYINSTGIALVVQILAQARSHGTTVRACGLSDHFRHIFEITRLADFMSFYPDEAAATGEGVAAPLT